MPDLSKIDQTGLDLTVTPLTVGTLNASAYGGKLNVTNAGQASAFFWNAGIGSGHVGFTAASSNLKVYNTYATGLMPDGKGIDINANGVVSHASNPSFWYTLSADQTGYSSGPVDTVTVKFNQLIANVANAYNPATGLFTAPVTGTYAFYVGIYSAPNSFDQVWSLINGVRTNSFVVGVVVGNQSGSCIQRLNQGDTFGVKVYSSGVSTMTITANSLHTFFSGCLIG